MEMEVKRKKVFMIMNNSIYPEILCYDFCPLFRRCV